MTGRHLVTPSEDYLSPEHRADLIEHHWQKTPLVTIFADGEGIYSLSWARRPGYPGVDGPGALVEGEDAYWDLAHALEHAAGECWHYQRVRSDPPKHRAPEGEDVIDDVTSRIAPEPKPAGAHVNTRPFRGDGTVGTTPYEHTGFEAGAL